MLKIVADAQVKKQKALLQMEHILSQAETTGGGDLTEAQQEEFDTFDAQAKEAQLILDREGIKQTKRLKAGQRELANHDDGPEAYTDLSGKIFYALRPGDKICDYYEQPLAIEGVRSENLSFGRYLRALLTGDWRGAEAENAVFQASMSSSNASGGYLIPNILSNELIDLARSKSVLIEAGARTIVWDEGGDMRFARVSADPTVQVKGENDSFTDAPPSLDSILIVPYFIGCYCTMSRELASDAPNSASLIQSVLAKALAAAFDAYCLAGTGSQEPLGIVNMDGINSVTVGTLSHDDIIDGIAEIKIDNHKPNTVIFHPSSEQALSKLVVASEARNYVEPPEAVRKLKQLITTGIDATQGLVGDFTQAILGMRRQISIETSTVAGDTFKKHQIALKCYLRGNIVLEHSDAFCLLDEI